MDTALRDAAKEYMVRYGGDAFPNLFVSAKGTIVRDDAARRPSRTSPRESSSRPSMAGVAQPGPVRPS
jgi:hypothetical protein